MFSTGLAGVYSVFAARPTRFRGRPRHLGGAAGEILRTLAGFGGRAGDSLVGVGAGCVAGKKSGHRASGVAGKHSGRRADVLMRRSRASEPVVRMGEVGPSSRESGWEQSGHRAGNPDASSRAIEPGKRTESSGAIEPAVRTGPVGEPLVRMGAVGPSSRYCR